VRNKPAGPKSLARIERTQGHGKAVTILAQKLARAGYDLLKRETAFDLDHFFNE
jgi:hypothetical protein